MKRLLLILVLLWASHCFAAAPTLVQVSPNTCFTQSSTTITCAFPANVTAGNMVIACIGIGQGVTINTPTMLGETFTKITGMSNAGTAGQGQVACYAANSAVGGHNSLSWTVGTADDKHVHMIEVSGQSTSPQDAVGNTNSTACSVSTSTATTNANDLLFAFFFDFANNRTFTAGTGYTQAQQTNNATGGDSAFSEDETVSATGTQTATCNQSLDNKAQGLIAIAGGGAAPTPTCTIALMGAGPC